MSRFNTRGHQAKPAVATVTSPIGTTKQRTRTFEGGSAWVKDDKTDLFLRASASFNDGGNKFYETGYQRDEKLCQLAQKVAVEDFAWFAQFVKWLRRVANIRTSALMVAADGVKARLDAGLAIEYPDIESAPFVSYSNRTVIDSVLYRADEPGELLAYWMAQYGRRVPKPVKRGVADAVRRLYNERSLLKYDTASHAFRFADVINLCHPTPKELVGVTRWKTDFSTGVDCPTPAKVRFPTSYIHPAVRERADCDLHSYLCRCGWYHLTSHAPDGVPEYVEREAKRIFIAPATPQGDLFNHAIDRRYGKFVGIPESLRVIHANFGLREDERLDSWLNPEFLKDAGMTWEDALSAVGSKVDKAKLWEAMIPSMGYMALLRNLRNFDEAGISNKVVQQVIAKLTDEDEVAKSRQLPFRFYSAHKNVSSLRWGQALETALDLCVANVPELPGKTLVLTDTSQSMTKLMSEKSSIMCLEAAGLFASAIAQRNASRVEMHQYATRVAPLDVPKGGSVLRMVEAIKKDHSRVGWGTNISGAVRATYRNHDRVIIFTDGQGTENGRLGASGVASSVPADIPVYLFNIEGYSASPMPTGKAARFDLGGLSDQTFKLIPLLESGTDGGWPWELGTES